MIYTEYVDLGRCKECHICIVALDGKVSARMTFYNKRKNTYNIFMYKDTDADVVNSFSYGDEIPDEYKSDVLKSLEAAMSNT